MPEKLVSQLSGDSYSKLHTGAHCYAKPGWSEPLCNLKLGLSLQLSRNLP